MKIPTTYLSRSDDNAWARGCSHCRYGVVSAPELTRACDLHMERLVQAMNKSIEFCDCKAGTRYHVYLKNRYRILIEEARREAPNDARMMTAAAKGSHPDIEIADILNGVGQPAVRGDTCCARGATNGS